MLDSACGTDDYGPMQADLDRRALTSIPPYAIRDDVLDQNMHAALLAFAVANEALFVPAMIGKGVIDPRQREAMLLPNEVFHEWRVRLKPIFAALATQLAQACRLSDFAPKSFEIKMIRYGDGGFYDRHVDVLPRGQATENKQRRLSMVYYFHRRPKAFEGGELRIHSFDSSTSVDLEPCDNRMIAFLPMALHEVRPVKCRSNDKTATRFSINIWALS